MRILVYLLIAAFAFYLGYKISEIIVSNKGIKSNIIPIVDELKIQLKAIQEKLNSDITADQKVELEAQKNKILDLLGKFYGYSSEELKNILNKAVL